MTTKTENSKKKSVGSDQSSSSAIPAAGPWQKGQPAEEGDYLIKFRHRNYDGIKISTGRYLPDHGWLNKFPEMDILEYAKINE